MWTVKELREHVCRKLEGVPELSGIPVIPEDKQNIATEINKALSQMKGIVIVVNTGDGRSEEPNNPNPVAEVSLLVEIAEIPAINRTPRGSQIAAVDAMGIVVSALHHHVEKDKGCLAFRGWGFENAKLITYTPEFTTRVRLKPQERKH
jgi:hypothetical protein